MEFVSELFNYLQNGDAAMLVVFFAAFGVPLFSLLVYLLFRLLRIKVGRVVSQFCFALTLGYMVLGFITQFILCFSGVPALKMVLIWLAMVIVYGVFALLNWKMIAKASAVLKEIKD